MISIAIILSNNQVISDGFAQHRWFAQSVFIHYKLAISGKFGKDGYTILALIGIHAHVCHFKKCKTNVPDWMDYLMRAQESQIVLPGILLLWSLLKYDRVTIYLPPRFFCAVGK